MPEQGKRVTGHGFFLTWSRVEGGSVADLELFIAAIVKPTRYIVAEEQHADGGLHYHAYFEFENRIDRRVHRQWDYHGQHPNIQQKTKADARENAFYYCTKDGWFRCSGEWEDGYVSVCPADTNLRARLADGLEASSSLLQYMQWGLDNDIPPGAISATWNASKSNADTLTDDTEIVGEIISPELQLRTYETTTRRSIVVVGRSGIGKTTWVRKHAPKPALMVSHIDDLKQFRPGYHVSLIFDDMHFNGDESGKGAWPRTSQIHLVDRDLGRSINVKHSVVHIPRGVHKFFTGNTYMFRIDEAIARRVFLIDIFN